MAERLCWNTTNTVIIHSIEADVVAIINRNHRNSKYFPTHFLNNAIFASADDILLVIPSKAIIRFCAEIEAIVPGHQCG